MRRRGRPVLGAICGLFLGIFVALDLLMFNVRPLDTLSVVVLPLVGLVLGIVIGLAAPFGKKAPPPTGP
jgi:uncharacterized YccA/Bax inhibitor family protein